MTDIRLQLHTILLRKIYLTKEKNYRFKYRVNKKYGPAAIRTQDLTVISRALHQAKLRAQMSGYFELSELKGFFRESVPIRQHF